MHASVQFDCKKCFFFRLSFVGSVPSLQLNSRENRIVAKKIVANRHSNGPLNWWSSDTFHIIFENFGDFFISLHSIPGHNGANDN